MANITNQFSTRDGVARSSEQEPLELFGYAAKYAVILAVKRLGITRPADVLNDLESRHFRIAGQRPLEVVRSIMKREAGFRCQVTPTLADASDFSFDFAKRVSRPPPRSVGKRPCRR